MSKFISLHSLTHRETTKSPLLPIGAPSSFSVAPRPPQTTHRNPLPRRSPAARPYVSGPSSCRRPHRRTPPGARRPRPRRSSPGGPTCTGSTSRPSLETSSSWNAWRFSPRKGRTLSRQSEQRQEDGQGRGMSSPHRAAGRRGSAAPGSWGRIAARRVGCLWKGVSIRRLSMSKSRGDCEELRGGGVFEERRGVVCWGRCECGRVQSFGEADVFVTLQCYKLVDIEVGIPFLLFLVLMI